MSEETIDIGGNPTGTPPTNDQIAQIRESLWLGNVDNTSDADKPVSTATANALTANAALKANLSGGNTISGAQTLTGQVELTGQAATTTESAITRRLAAIECSRRVQAVNMDPATWSTTATGSGAAINTPNNQISIRTGSAGASTMLARNNANGHQRFLNFGGNNTQTTARWGEPWEISFWFSMQISDAAFVRRIQFGKPYNSTTIGDLSNRGVALKIENLALKLQAHDGTALYTTATLATLSVDQFYHARLSLDGTGNITLYLDGASIGALSTGPNATGSGLHNGIEVSVDNGGSLAFNVISVYDIAISKP